MQEATAHCLHSELVGDPLRLEPNLTSPVGHVTELCVLENEYLRLQLIKFVLLEKNLE